MMHVSTKTLVLFMVLPLLQGCAGDQHNRFVAPESSKRHGTMPEAWRDEPRAEVVEAEQTSNRRAPVSQASASENNTQQNQTGLLNAAVAKIAENVDASLVRMETVVDTKLSASLKASAELNAKIAADLRAELKAELKAELQAQATAQAQGIAGIGNRLDAVTQTISSGRDTNNTQFTPEMANVVMSAHRQSTWVALGVAVLALAGACVWIVRDKEKSRQRAEERAKGK